MKISMRITLFIAIILLVPALAHAQSGCSDSPECSTAVLCVVGACGSAIGSAIYSRFRSRQDMFLRL